MKKLIAIIIELVLSAVVYGQHALPVVY